MFFYAVCIYLLSFTFFKFQSVVDKEFNFLTKQNEKDISSYSLPRAGQSGLNQSQPKDITPHILNEGSNDLMSHVMMPSTSHITPPSPDILNTQLTGCELEMMTYPYKNIPSSFPHDYDYSLVESHLGKSDQDLNSAIEGIKEYLYWNKTKIMN